MKGNRNGSSDSKRGNGRSAASSSNGSSYSTKFVNLPLSEADKAAIAERERSGKIGLHDVLLLVSEGFKVSIGWNEKTGSFISAVTDIVATRPMFNHCYSSFASSPEKALLVALYKYEVYIEGRETWGSSESPRDEFG